MPNVSVFELQISHDPNKLFAFTHGRGAYRARLLPLTNEFALAER